MAESSIDQVRQEELKAEETLRLASQRASEMVDAAETEAARLATQAEEAAETRAAGQVAEAHRQSQQVLQQALEGLSSDMDALAEKARAAQPQAIDVLVKALV